MRSRRKGRDSPEDRFEDVTNPQGPRGLRKIPLSDKERSSIIQELEERTLPDGLRSLHIGGSSDSDARPGTKKAFMDAGPIEAFVLGHMMADEIGLVVKKGTPLFDFLKEEIARNEEICLDGMEQRYRDFLKRPAK